MKVFICVLLFACVAFAYTRTVSYEGDKVYRCKAVRRMEVDYLYDAVHQFGLDIWAHTVKGEIDVRIKKDQQRIHAIAERLQGCQVVIEDVEEYITQYEKDWASSGKKAEWHEEYHTYDEIVAWYQSLAATYPTLTTWVPSIGKSFEGRDQPAIHFTAPGGSNKKTIYVQCQIHAREWISGAVCQYIVDNLLANYGSVQNVTSLFETTNFVFVPFTNPDGYSHTWNGDRLWRKNRQTNSGSACIGTDVNRNYNSHWGEGGSSSNPCSDTYMGASPASAPETQNTVAYFKKQSSIIGAIDMHSYSQLILRPWGYTSANSPDETFLKSVGDGMRQTILNAGGVSYTSQKSIDLYVTTGTASDWFYDDEATESNDGYRAAGFTIELRDTGRYGFVLPPSEIIPNGNEIYHAFIYFAERVNESPIEV